MIIRRFSLVPAVALMILSLATFATVAQTPRSAPTAGNLYADIIPPLADQVRLATAGRLPVYTVSANLVPASAEPGRIEGSFRLDLPNFTSDLLSDVHLRLYPNFQDYGGGSMSIADVTVDGSPVTPSFGADPTLATIPLPVPIQPNDWTTIELSFVTTIPSDPVTSYGMFGYFSDTDSYNLAQWLPLLAGWDPESGWLLDWPNTVGDPVFSNAAMFDISFTAPSTLTFVTSGTEVGSESLGVLTTHNWVAGPMRDFVMSGGSSLNLLEQQVGETTIRSWYFPGYEAAAAMVLQYGVDSFEVFSTAFGAYPYTEMDLIQTRLGDQAAGVEFPGLMYIGTSHYDARSTYLEFTTVHEVAHQWWYGTVGNNQYVDAFIDEALANASSIIYKEQVFGTEAADQWVRDFLKRPYLTSLFGNMGDMIVHQPTAAFGSNGPYGRMVYGKGGLGFETIRRTIGDAAFFEGLQQYYEQFQFGIANPPALLAALESASGLDLSELWAHWFERAEGAQDFTPEDLLELNA